MSERPTDPHHSTFVAADSEPLSEENEKSEQRLLKVAAAVEQQLAQAEQQLAQATGETPDVVVLPDGRVINLDQLLNAIQSGSDSIPLDDGDAISVEDLLVAFGMEPHVPEIGDEERVENTQASFTPGPLLEMLKSLVERGVIDPTELNYGLFDQEEILFLLDGLADISLLNWSLEGAGSVTEGDTTTYTVSYTGVTLSPGQMVTISVATGGGFDSNPDDATPGSDYTTLGTVLTFTGGGPTSQTVAVSTIDDTIVEGSEDFIVTLVDPTAGTLITSQANTIIEDDGDSSLLNWSIAGSSEITEGEAPATYTVSYTGAELAPGQTVTISIATGAGFDGGLADATSGSDYTALGTVLTFTSGATSQTVAVSTIEDTIVEGDEDFSVTLSGAGAGTIVASQANTVIDANDGSLLNWSIAGSSEVSEGGTAGYTVSYTGATLATGQTVTISVGTGAGFDGSLADATSGSDYTSLGTVLTFTSGATSQTVAVSTIEDTIVEGDEDFSVTLSNAGAGTIVASQANTVIDANDGSLLNWSIAGSSEVSEGGTAGYTVSYTGATLATGQTVTISVGTGAGYDGSLADATSGSDYTALGTVLTFTSGATSQTVAVSTIEDTIVEGDEDFSVTIANPTAGTIVASQANTVIDANDGSLLNWSIAGSSEVSEGGTAGYTVSYTGATLATGQTVTISVATGGGFDASSVNDATAGSDYTSLGTVLTFTSGATSQAVAVSTIEDTIVEGDEDFSVTLSNAGAGTIVASQANTVIDANDGSLLNWSIAGSSEVAEGGTAGYTVSYTGATLATGQTVTISVGTSAGFDGSLADATAGSDYTSLGTVLTFTSGATSQTVAVSTIEDTIVEGDEDFTVTLSGAGAGTIVASQANTVIDANDGSLLNWSIAGSSEVSEGGTAGYTVSYTGATLATGQTVTISVGTSAGFDGSLADATAGSDYTSLGTVLTFTSGATSQTVAVSTIEDTIVEGDEDFTVTLANAGAGTIVTSQANTVIDANDGSLLNWSIAGSSEIVEGGAPGSYTVSYTGATIAGGQTVTISVATGGGFDGSLADATAGSDYTTLGTVLTFTSGATSQTVAVSTIEDTIVEGDEDFTVTLTNAGAGTIVTSQANTVIDANDGSLLNWSIAGSSEIVEGGAPGSYTVSYTGATIAGGQTVTISVATGGGFDGSLADATSGSDYTALGTVLTFTSGATFQTVAVSTIEDTIVEGDEDFSVTIANPTAGTIVASQANTVIDANDGSLLNWSIAGSSEVSEGGTAGYTVSYTGATLATGQTVTISVGTGAGYDGSLADATSGSDYTSLGTVLTFTSGATSQTVAVSTIEDTIVESDEDFTVTLSNAGAGTIVTSQANTVIEDDGDAVVFNIAGMTSVDEGDTATYTVTYTGATLAPGQTATVSVATNSGFTSTLSDATAGSDFTALGTMLTFTGGGVTSRTVSVSTVDDTIVEGDEDYTVRLSAPTNGTLGASQANTVIDDANVDPIVAPLCLWVPDNFTNFMTGIYANGYPLSIPAPTDPNGDTLTVADFTLPANGTIWYQLGGGGAFTQLTNVDDLTIAEFQSLVFRPNANNTSESGTFTYWVNDGDGGLTQGTVELHDVAQSELEGPSVSIGSRTANSPLNSGNGISTSFNVTGEVITALSEDDGRVKVATNFQIAPFDTPIPVGEQGAALAALINQVAVRLVIGGVTFNVVVPDNGNPGSGDNTEYWVIDNDPNSLTFGIWIAEVPATEIWNEAGTQTLEQYLNLNTPNAGDVWAVEYEDLLGGNEQARFVEFSFGATTDTLLGGIHVDALNSDCADEPNLIYGTTLGDTLIGGNANDRIFGREGDDILDGGAGDDSLDGGAGDDAIMGGEGNDTILGGVGIDDLIDWSDATTGITHTLVTSDSFTSVAVAGLGTDYYSGIEGIIGGSGADNLTGNASENILIGNEGNDTLSGADASDTIRGGDNDDSIMGGNQNDQLLGEDGNDTILGGAGDDTVSGGIGNDYLLGGTGADLMNSGAGDDIMRFSDADNDSIDGAAGIDALLLDQLSLNFDNVSDGQVSGIEILNLGRTDGVSRAVTLDAQDVIDFEAATGVSVDPDAGGGLGVDIIDLVIQGQAGDTVSLDGTGGGNPNWSTGVTAQALAGYVGTYSIFYATDGTVVAVEDAVSVAIVN